MLPPESSPDHPIEKDFYLPLCGLGKIGYLHHCLVIHPTSQLDFHSCRNNATNYDCVLKRRRSRGPQKDLLRNNPPHGRALLGLAFAPHPQQDPPKCALMASWAKLSWTTNEKKLSAILFPVPFMLMSISFTRLQQQWIHKKDIVFLLNCFSSSYFVVYDLSKTEVVCLSISLSICLVVCLSVYLSLCLLICLSVK